MHIFYTNKKCISKMICSDRKIIGVIVNYLYGLLLGYLCPNKSHQ